MVKKEKNWNYKLETNDFSCEQMAYILFLFFYQTEIEPCLPFAVLLAKSVLDETRRFEKCSHIPEKKLDTQKRGRKAR